MAADSVVVVHRGRRYKRAQQRPRDEEKKNETAGQSQSSITTGHLPQPPPIICPPTELVRSPQAASAAQLFQKYKPLPPIGACPSAQQTMPQSTVSVCVRLPDGSRLSSTLPTSSSLLSLVTAALRHSSHLSQGPADGWTLCTSEVPKRELKDLSLSLHQAHLTHSCTLHLVPPDS